MLYKWIVALILMTTNCFGLSVSNAPATLILANHSSGLDHPEGVAFTPSGEYVAVANALINTITFYKRVDDQDAVYETTPSFSIQGPESQLNYPHDLSFSRDGAHLAVANREGHTITIYKYNTSLCRYDPSPIAIIRGKSSQVNYPDAVKYSPVENSIVVANMYSNILTFYHYQGDEYVKRPYQVIQNPILNVPDGLDFSRDGQVLAVTSHDAHCVVLYQRLSRSQGMYKNSPIQILQAEETDFCYPHSVAFHPSKNYLAVSSSQGRKNLHIFRSISGNPAAIYSNSPEMSLEILEMYDTSTIVLLDQLEQEGGVKGIAFAPDGKSLAVVQNLPQDVLQSSLPVGVLAIYPLDLFQN